MDIHSAQRPLQPDEREFQAEETPTSLDQLGYGYRIGEKYIVESLLGQGGMGAVYRATQLNLGRKVAVKVLKGELVASDLALKRFEREAKVAAALDHPNAVHIYDFGVDAGLAYIVMELLSGQSLRERLSSFPEGLPLGASLEIASYVVSVLVRAHEMGLVHRDLKPENVFIESVGGIGKERVVVVDFGLAFIEGRGELGRLT
ncbi:MAG: serine/threonine-protein kinase, partial [Sandaracinaceae bacterium]|nr:serine/threonine-protein kinase [Sandaracinaceae bacterium]